MPTQAVVIRATAAVLFLLWTSLALAQGGSVERCRFSPDQFENLYLSAKIDRQGTLGARNEDVVTDLYERGIAELRKFYYEDVPLDDRHRLRATAAPVGRLDLLLRFEAGECVEVCTAWLVSDDVAVTAGHCTGQPSATIQRAKLVMNFEGNRSTQSEIVEVDPAPLKVSAQPAYDFALFRLREPAGRRYGKLELYQGPVRNAHSLVIIGHPFAQPKQMVRADCYAALNFPVDGTILRHTCNTFPSMSGAPLVDEESGKVVAIHRGGVRPTVNNPNQAILLSKLVAARAELAAFIPGLTPPVVSAAIANVEPPSISERISGPTVSQTISFAVADNSAYFQQGVQPAIDGANELLRASACPLELTGPSQPTVLPTMPTVVASEDDFNRLVNLPGTIKLVDSINWCGAPTPFRVLDCAQPRKSAVVDLRSTSRKSVVLLHALGHLAGLAHQEETFMSASSQTSNAISADQCRALRSAVGSSAPRRIFIHIGTEAQRSAARGLSRRLSDEGWSPEGIENVAAKGLKLPDKAEVRYSAEIDAQGAQAVAQTMQKLGIRSASPVRLPLPRRIQLEVWFPRAT